MENLVDTFILVPKEKWREVICNVHCEENRRKVLKEIGKNGNQS